MTKNKDQKTRTIERGIMNKDYETRSNEEQDKHWRTRNQDHGLRNYN